MANELRLCADNIRRAQDAANGIIEAKVVEIQELPFFTAMQSTEEVVHLATVEGVKVTESALNIVKNNPALAVAEGSVAGAAKEVVRQTGSITSSKVASKNNYVNSTNNVPDKVYDTLNEINKTGVAPHGYKGGREFTNDGRCGCEISQPHLPSFVNSLPPLYPCGATPVLFISFNVSYTLSGTLFVLLT